MAIFSKEKYWAKKCKFKGHMNKRKSLIERVED